MPPSWWPPGFRYTAFNRCEPSLQAAPRLSTSHTLCSSSARATASTPSLRFNTMGKFLRRHFGRMRRIRQARARNALQNSWPHYAPELIELEQIRREDAAWTPTEKPRGAAVGESSDDSDAEAEDQPLGADLYAHRAPQNPKDIRRALKMLAQFHSKLQNWTESFRGHRPRIVGHSIAAARPSC